MTNNCKYLLVLPMLIFCREALAQDLDSAYFRHAGSQKIVFYDSKVSHHLKGIAAVHVYFEGSLMSKQTDVDVTFLQFSAIGKVPKKDAVKVRWSDVSKERFKKSEQALIDRYLPKIDSMFRNGQYDRSKNFLPGSDRSITAMTLSCIFEIVPK